MQNDADTMTALSQREIHQALDVGRLLNEAQEIAGLQDYGAWDVRTPLSQIQRCYSEDAPFHAEGLRDFRNEILRILVNRLRFEDDLKRHPEILDEDVSDPIVIIGLPRSGTTKTLRMMAADPGLLKTTMWQLVNPAPFPDTPVDSRDPRIRAAYADTFLDETNAAIQAGHFYGPHEVNEDVWLYDMTFNEHYFRTGRTPSAAFQRWARERTEPPERDNYRYVRRIVQYLQWQQGGRKGRRWLMKNTNHISHLDELLETYPNATLMHIHRKPVSCVASVAKLSAVMWKQRITDPDVAYSGRYHLERTKWATDRYMAARDRLGLDDRILDVPYEQIRSDPMTPFREIYRRAGLELTPHAEAAMLAWERQNEQGKHGEHRYSLDEIGLSEQLINDTLKDYIARFIK